MITSDTSRLFGVGSGGTMLLGGASGLQMTAYPTNPTRSFWAADIQTATSDVNGVAQVTWIASGFSALVGVVACQSNGTYLAQTALVSVATSTATGASILCFNSAGVALSGVTIMAFAIGTSNF